MSEQSRKESGSKGGEGWMYSTLQSRTEDRKAICKLPVAIKKLRIMTTRTARSYYIIVMLPYFYFNVLCSVCLLSNTVY